MTAAFPTDPAVGKVRCVGATPSLVPPPRDESQPLTPDAVLRDFQRHTAWMYADWFDWSPIATWLPVGGTPPPPPSSSRRASSRAPGTVVHEGRLVAGHNEATQLYEAFNLCLRPGGRPAGFRPQVSPYRGQDDTFFTVPQKVRKVQEWLSTVEALAEPPSHVLDADVLLFPITMRIDNTAHTYHRMGSLLRLKDEAFPNASKAFRRDILIAWVVIPEGTYLTGPTIPDGPMPYEPGRYILQTRRFYQALSGYSFAVWGFDVTAPEHRPYLKEKLGFDPSADALRRPVCFRKAFVWFNCLDSGCGAAAAQPGRQVAFHIGDRVPFAERDAATVDLLRGTMQRCFSPTNVGRVVRRRSPRVLFSLRSISRRFTRSPFIIRAVSDVVAEFDGVLDVVEDGRLGAAALVDRFSSADVAFGVHGANLIWATLMPPGAAVVEVSYKGMSNWRRNAELAGVKYIGRSLAEDWMHTSFAGGPGADVHVPPEVFALLVREALCVVVGKCKPRANAASEEELWADAKGDKGAVAARQLLGVHSPTDATAGMAARLFVCRDDALASVTDSGSDWTEPSRAQNASIDASGSGVAAALAGVRARHVGAAGAPVNPRGRPGGALPPAVNVLIFHPCSGVSPDLVAVYYALAAYFPRIVVRVVFLGKLPAAQCAAAPWPQQSHVEAMRGAATYKEIAALLGNAKCSNRGGTLACDAKQAPSDYAVVLGLLGRADDALPALSVGGSPAYIVLRPGCRGGFKASPTDGSSTP